MEQTLNIVYNCEKTSVGLVQCFDYERGDYTLASKKIFLLSDREEAIKHARKLALENNLGYDVFDKEDEQAQFFLD